MAENRVFTQEELDYLCIPPHIKLKDAVRSGDKEKAKQWLDVVFPLYTNGFDLRVKWDKRLTDKIYEELGGEGLVDVWKYRGFTDEEINAMKIQQSDVDEMLGYIEADDREAAEKWIDREYYKFNESHNIRIDWETRLKTYIYENLGEEKTWEVMRLVVEDYYNPTMVALLRHNFDFRYRVESRIAGLMSHGMYCHAEEDDVKCRVIMTPCGSGTYLLEHHVYEAPKNYSLCKACPNTFGIDKFPIYCTHSPIQEMISIERFGWPNAVNTPYDLIDDPDYVFAKECCHFDIFKDPSLVPDRVYEMLGKKRPDTYEFPGYEGFVPERYADVIK